MHKHLPSVGMLLFLSICTLLLGFQTFFTFATTVRGSVSEDGDMQSEVPYVDPNDWTKTWKRPDVPPTVGLQVGHWKNSELPEELSDLIGNTGASGGGSTELEANLGIAHATAAILEAKGVHVDILPATVPQDYWADAFIAIHADGSKNTTISGFKMAGPWQDITGKSDDLVSTLENEYATDTKLPKDPNITANMRGYYAFAWWRLDHAIHPMTTAAIVETGFISNPHDRELLINQPQIPAHALAQGIMTYLQSQGLIES